MLERSVNGVLSGLVGGTEDINDNGSDVITGLLEVSGIVVGFDGWDLGHDVGVVLDDSGEDSSGVGEDGGSPSFNLLDVTIEGSAFLDLFVLEKGNDFLTNIHNGLDGGVLEVGDDVLDLNGIGVDGTEAVRDFRKVRSGGESLDGTIDGLSNTHNVILGHNLDLEDWKSHLVELSLHFLLIKIPH